MVRNPGDYRRPSYNEKIVLKRYITQLHNAAKFFKTYFVGKIVTYSTKEEQIDIHFSVTNFMHLCGIDYKKGSASFFDDCLNHNIRIDDIKIKKDGTTNQKLQVLGSISELVGSHVYLVGNGKYLYLEFDYALRTKKQILALTLKDTSRKIVPQSLLDLKRQKTFSKGSPVEEIFATKYSDGSKQYYLRK